MVQYAACGKVEHTISTYDGWIQIIYNAALVHSPSVGWVPSADLRVTPPSTAFNAGKAPDKLQTLTRLPKAFWGEGNWADTRASDSKTRLGSRLLESLFQSEKSWAPPAPCSTQELKKKNLLFLGMRAFGDSSGDPQTQFLYLVQKYVFLEDTHQMI